MKPIYDESLYCTECDEEISVREDLFLGHLCEECYEILQEEKKDA